MHPAQFLHDVGLYESSDESLLREDVLSKLDALVKEWSRRVADHLGLADSVGDGGARVYTFGSYRLGVHGPGADIDTLCVGPRHVLREEHFFGSDSWCLQKMLEVHDDALIAADGMHTPHTSPCLG